MRMAVFALILLTTSCAPLKNLGAENARIAQCHAKAGEIEFHDSRTGYPFLSQAHRASCEVDPNAPGGFAWKNEEESGVDLSGDIVNQGFQHFNWGPKL